MKQRSYRAVDHALTDVKIRPNRAKGAEGMSVNAHRVYLIYCQHANDSTGETYPGITKIAARLAMHPRTARRAREELVNAEWLLYRGKRKSPNGKWYNVYTLRPEAFAGPSEGAKRASDRARSTPSDRASSPPKSVRESVSRIQRAPRRMERGERSGFNNPPVYDFTERGRRRAVTGQRNTPQWRRPPHGKRERNT